VQRILRDITILINVSLSFRIYDSLICFSDYRWLCKLQSSFIMRQLWFSIFLHHSVTEVNMKDKHTWNWFFENRFSLKFPSFPFLSSLTQSSSVCQYDTLWSLIEQIWYCPCPLGYKESWMGCSCFISYSCWGNVLLRWCNWLLWCHQVCKWLEVLIF